MQPGTNDIVTAVVKSNIPFWPGPFFFRILQGNIIPSDVDHVHPGYTHTGEHSGKCFVDVFKIFSHDLTEYDCPNPSSKNIDQTDGQKNLPAYIHKLVYAESGKSPAKPHHDKNQENDLTEHPEHTPAG